MQRCQICSCQLKLRASCRQTAKLLHTEINLQQEQHWPGYFNTTTVLDGGSSARTHARAHAHARARQWLTSANSDI